MSIYDVLLFIFGIIFHELGHYIMFRFYGYKANVKFTWWGILIGDNVAYKTKLIHIIPISFMGILLGYPFFMHSEQMIVVYTLMCAKDISDLLYYFSLPKKYKDWTLIRIAKKQIRDLERKK